MHFKKRLYESGRKPNKIWADQGSVFYNRSLKSWLYDNCIEIFSTHNKRKIFVAERFIRTLKKTIYKHMTAVSKKIYKSKLHEIVDKYNNTS